MEQKDIQTSAQLTVLVMYTIFTILLIGVAVILSWELWPAFLFVIGIVVAWSVHIGQRMNLRMRSYIYVVLILVDFFYYAIHDTSYYDMPVVICLIMIVISVFDETKMMYMGFASYVLVLIYHAIVTGIFFKMETILDFARLGLQVATVIVATVLSRYMIKRRQEEKNNYSKVISQLQNINQRSEDFLANISHELRTPINAIIGTSDIIQRKNRDSEIKGDMDIIQKASRRLYGQISDILDYSELIADRFVSSDDSYETASMINDIINSAAVMNEDKNLDIIFDVSSKLPSVMVGEEARIRRILDNIISNSIKFTERGGVIIRINFREEEYGVNLYFDIEDTGIGMDEGQFVQIYNQFYQVDSGRSRKAGGIGLGLSIVHGLISSMGGFMDVSSKKGHGTRISFCLPQKVENREPFVTLENMKEKHVLCFLRKEKYENARIRDFYDETIRHMGEELRANIYRVFDQEEAERYIAGHNVTHVVTSDAEYGANMEYFNEIGKHINVILVLERKWNKPVPSHMYVVQKPFSVFSMAMAFMDKEFNSGKKVVDADEELYFKDVEALVVDDDILNLSVAGGILSNYGLEVETAAGGIEAVRLCEELKFDVIFMDHMMPDVDGIEATRRIRKQAQSINKNVPIIAFTANAVSGAREMFLKEGFSEFLPKPMERSNLERVLKKVLPEDKIGYRKKDNGIIDMQGNDLIETAPGRESVVQGSAEPATPEQVVERLADFGFNVEAGLQYCAGSKEFYMELLDSLCDDSVSKIEDLKNAYTNHDLKTYILTIHTLKGNSRTAGADTAADLAEGLQKAGERHDMEYIDSFHGKFLDEFDTVIKNIRTALS